MTEHSMNVFIGLIGELPLRPGETVIGTRAIRMAEDASARDDEFVAVTSLGRLLWVRHESYFGDASMRRRNNIAGDKSLDGFKHDRANKFQAEVILSQQLSDSLMTEKLQASS